MQRFSHIVLILLAVFYSSTTTWRVLQAVSAPTTSNGVHQLESASKDAREISKKIFGSRRHIPLAKKIVLPAPVSEACSVYFSPVLEQLHKVSSDVCCNLYLCSHSSLLFNKAPPLV